MSVCAIHRNDTYTRSQCKNIDYRYPLPLGGSTTVHFDQLVVANVIFIRKAGLLTLCEVDVLGTNVALSPEGQCTAWIIIIFSPQGRIVGSAPGHFPSVGSRVIVVLRVTVSVSVNRVRVRMGDGK